MNLENITHLPIFAPYKKQAEITPDLPDCAANLQNFAVEDLITHDDSGISIHDHDGEFSKFLNLNSKSYQHKTKSGQEISANKASFKSLNLTYLPDLPNSLRQQFFTDSAGQKKSYLFLPTDNWHWRTDLMIEPLKLFVTGLGLQKIHLVRLIYLNPPAVGGVHVDASADSMQKYYEIRHGVSLTFNLKSGDGRLFYRSGNQILQIDPSLDAWHFNPSVPHAVGEVYEQRVQLRVFGSLEPQAYLDRLDMTRAQRS